ncbi:MAG: protease complex subunit PrcB family protein [Elusimicrobia bacterium]|nr:protease complex subunit PrcB family protein [Elusimicrobiota bacterium]
MKRPVTTIVAALALALCAGLILLFFSAYRKGIVIRLEDGSLPPLPPPPSAAPGEPAPGYTNEQLHGLLQQETAQLGIQRFLARGESVADETEAGQGGFLGPRLGAPGSRAQADAAIREIARLRRGVDAGKKKPVPLAGRVVPVLAQPEPGGTALEKEPRPAPPPQAARPQPAMTFGPGCWSGLYGGAQEGTLTVSDAKAWAELWAGLSRKRPPRLDFSRQQVVGVFLGLQPTGGFRVEISSEVVSLPAALVVRYRVLSPPADRAAPEGATAPFALRAIPRSALPVRFERRH